MGAANTVPGFHESISEYEKIIFNDLIKEANERPLKDYELKWLHQLALANDKLGYDGPLMAYGIIALTNNFHIK